MVRPLQIGDADTAGVGPALRDRVGVLACHADAEVILRNLAGRVDRLDADVGMAERAEVDGQERCLLAHGGYRWAVEQP